MRQVGESTEFHAKLLSTTEDWGEAVSFVRYIPTSTMWVAPQMALKSASKTVEDAHSGEDDDAEGTTNTNHSATLAKYKKAIMDNGFHYF